MQGFYSCKDWKKYFNDVTNFLVKEGFISKDRFTSMFGLVGLAECVNTLLKAEKLEDKFGHSQIADDLGVRIMDAMEDFINNFESKHCTLCNSNFLPRRNNRLKNNV